MADPHMPPMSHRRGNIFRFRRLKWGDPKRLEGLKAIGLEPGPAKPEASSRRGISTGTIGLLIVGFSAAFAIGISVFSGF